MPILFYAPWAIFCTLAGYLADRYSKRDSLVLLEIRRDRHHRLALLGFWLGTHGQPPLGPWIVLSTVFLWACTPPSSCRPSTASCRKSSQPHMLSRGNGVLESLSFLAVILGTVFGGVLSHLFRRPGVHHRHHPASPWPSSARWPAC